MCLFTDDEKTDEKREEEKKVFEEFMEVVEQRNALVALLEEDRLKYVMKISTLAPFNIAGTVRAC